MSTTLLLPIDIVKVRLQVNEHAAGSPNKRAEHQHRGPRRVGFFRIFRSILKHEGLGGLYVGWTPAMIGSAISWGGFYFFYEIGKKERVKYKLRNSVDGLESSEPSKVLNSLDNFWISCGAGAIMVFLTNPIWLVKTRIQLQMKKASLTHNIKPYRGMVDAFRTIIREEGPLALYRGVGPALLLTTHGGVQFVVYEYLRKHFHYQRAGRYASLDGGKMSVMERLELSVGYLSMGAVAKMVASTGTYPLQVMKARIQQRSEALEIDFEGNIRAVRREYRNLIGTAKSMFEKEGIAGFFKGCIPNAVRVAPSAALTFVTYETVLDLLQDNR